MSSNEVEVRDFEAFQDVRSPYVEEDLMTSSSFAMIRIPVRYDPDPASDDIQFWLRFRSAPLGRMGEGGIMAYTLLKGLGVYGGGDRFGQAATPTPHNSAGLNQEAP